jgi:hypothetical protein
LDLFQFLEKFVLGDEAFVNQQLHESIGHDVPPGGIFENHIKAVEIGQTS